ncbi:MAG: hypothetical protein OHK0038_02390 [Flammeovirgaceae bacterium]
MRFVLIFLIFSILLSSNACKQYENTTARFNAYFLAKEKLKEAELTLYGFPKDDYNELLSVLIPIDSNETRSQKAAFDYVIEKASIPIQFHETSKWVDDCYILIGKARLYQEDYANTISTFKYVNSKGKDAYARHQALIWMMRAFLETREFNNFKEVKEQINNKETEPFDKDNLRDYHLVMAQYHWEKEEFEVCVQHLEYAVPLVEFKDTRARYYFLMGQLYELLGNKTKAYESFRHSVKLSPPYDLWFNARLSANALAPLVAKEDMMSEKELNEFFEKLLKDPKNFDYRDKIYYEMAKHSLYTGELKKALFYLNESIQVSTNNATQKAHSYLRMGELYYDSLRDFKTAFYYYDSAMSSLPKSTRHYEKINERKEYLSELAKYLEIIENQDRLLNLAQLTGAALDSALALEISKEKEKAIQKKEAEEINAQKKDRQIVESQALVQDSENSWYFYNPSTVIQGKSAFLRTWGNRPLEDNWRRSRKVMLGNIETDNQIVLAEDNGLPQEEDIFANIKSIEDRKSEIPSTPEAQAEAKAKMEDAVFQAGKIIMFKLKEGKESMQMLGRMPKDYPQGEKTPEAIYLMYQHCLESKSCDPSPYKQLLINQYAETFYGKLLANPNHIKELNIDEKKVEALYKNAFNAYKLGNYKKASDLVNEIITLHPENAIIDKVKFLQVLITGKTTKHLAEYYAMLNKFIQDYPKSELLKNAEQLLKQISQKDLEKGSGNIEEKN